MIISETYFASRATVPGLVWVAGAALYLFCLPLLFGRKPGSGMNAAPKA
ncbi:hypothetical protein [Sphingomonas alpina]|uniref:Uncharacterized protein n=1 Tax=Sphingomonas alpina TaxID=653931 RepID=A0A7H0LN85_9SPHN|nr:hypothetical protein [Sphingomonas alpina]QNQ11138.1 hypothetical protein H3Z74_08290 [Sphingomonas alpina]